MPSEVPSTKERLFVDDGRITLVYDFKNELEIWTSDSCRLWYERPDGQRGRFAAIGQKDSTLDTVTFTILPGELNMPGVWLFQCFLDGSPNGSAVQRTDPMEMRIGGLV